MNNSPINEVQQLYNEELNKHFLYQAPCQRYTPKALPNGPVYHVELTGQRICLALRAER